MVGSKRVSIYSFSQANAHPTGDHTESAQVKRERDPVLFEEAGAVEGPGEIEAFPAGIREVPAEDDISAEILPCVSKTLRATRKSPDTAPISR